MTKMMPKKMIRMIINLVQRDGTNGEETRIAIVKQTN